MKRLALLAILIGCSSTPKPSKTEAPPVLPPPATAEQTCTAGQTPGEIKRFEHGVRSADEAELGRYTVEAATTFPVEVALGDQTFKIASPVRRCDGDGRMHFLGVQVEANGLRTVGFTPPQKQYDGFGAPTNACQINPQTYCKASCTTKQCTDAKCRTMQNVPVFHECSNPVFHELSRTTEAPTDAQKKQGIVEVAVIDRLVVREYEADVATGTWKSLVLVREQKREPIRGGASAGGNAASPRAVR